MVVKGRLKFGIDAILMDLFLWIRFIEVLKESESELL